MDRAWLVENVANIDTHAHPYVYAHLSMKTYAFTHRQDANKE